MIEVDADAPARVDGRAARGERTRGAIVEAHLALIDEGDLKPTGERIAERAGVSLRTLWTNFKDMETLYAATGQRVSERQESLFRPIPPEWPLSRRIAEFCAQRVQMLEALAPSARASALREPFSPQLRRNREEAIARMRREIELAFGPELAQAGEGREQLLDALTVASTWAAWSMMRDAMGLDVEAARGIMARTLGALLVDAIAAGLR
ncbi:TetR/AcrR family transcriptional regulator [Micromonospora sp. 4G57]|uniref:TetR/AcrR family transcriptional regulator n=1 Tax=Micromonospora sicca TaxID=2202420 RepID=A0ABU5J919_9ACTN|nr:MULTISPECIES: TetR/AcrR family transcriptional regulator [unclassified Micromonospora]MDZ5442209.1 TetR/AcrR family transcriptional regulator [Micromonospora sp. 4G57]MDZ5489014.1 TetR/AcrR family transcriptional regulator [Micromonospora sp. 4G53]